MYLIHFTAHRDTRPSQNPLEAQGVPLTDPDPLKRAHENMPSQMKIKRKCKGSHEEDIDATRRQTNF